MILFEEQSVAEKVKEVEFALSLLLLKLESCLAHKKALALKGNLSALAMPSYKLMQSSKLSLKVLVPR